MVHGVTRQWLCTSLGSHRVRAAKIARSAQSNRGLGLARRSTATSCRNTSSSTSFGGGRAVLWVPETPQMSGVLLVVFVYQSADPVAPSEAPLPL
jgi:hypothetical protein